MTGAALRPGERMDDTGDVSALTVYCVEYTSTTNCQLQPTAITAKCSALNADMYSTVQWVSSCVPERAMTDVNFRTGITL